MNNGGQFLTGINKNGVGLLQFYVFDNRTDDVDGSLTFGHYVYTWGEAFASAIRSLQLQISQLRYQRWCMR